MFDSFRDGHFLGDRKLMCILVFLGSEIEAAKRDSSGNLIWGWTRIGTSIGKYLN